MRKFISNHFDLLMFILPMMGLMSMCSLPFIFDFLTGMLISISFFFMGTIATAISFIRLETK